MLRTDTIIGTNYLQMEENEPIELERWLLVHSFFLSFILSFSGVFVKPGRGQQNN